MRPLNFWQQCVCECCHLSCVQLFATLWAVAHQALLFMEFSRQEYWSGLLCPPPGDLPNPWIRLASPALQAYSLELNHWGSPFEDTSNGQREQSRFTGSSSAQVKGDALEGWFSALVVIAESPRKILRTANALPPFQSPLVLAGT